MLTAIIIDDELHCIDRLSRLLDQYSAEIVVVGTYTDIDTGLAGIRKHQPGVVFLDVQIHETTGFDLLDKFDNLHFQVIFTTAHDQYAVRAFQFSATDYLLKPVESVALQLSIKKLKEKVTVEEISEKFRVLLQNLKEIQGSSKKIAIPTMSGLSFVQIGEIIRCESDINYTTLHLKEKRKLTVAKTLKEFEDLLTDHNFYRVHNSHLINLAYIKTYNKGKGGTVSMIDNTEIEVSTRRKDDFLRKLASM